MRGLLLGTVAGLAVAYYRLFGGPMEDTAWEIKLKADSFFAFPHHDTLIFSGGKLRASGSQVNGFTAGSYNAQRTDGDVDALWNASLRDTSRGTMTWHGLVRGDTIEGVAILVTKDGKEKRYTFSGKRA
jgi:hypothetical protein